MYPAIAILWIYGSMSCGGIATAAPARKLVGAILRETVLQHMSEELTASSNRILIVVVPKSRCVPLLLPEGTVESVSNNAVSGQLTYYPLSKSHQP